MSYTGLVDLKSCPCCNSGAHLTPMNTGHTVRFYVHCEHCGLRTPHYAVETEAIAAWNTRPDAIEALTRPVDVEAVATLADLTDAPGWIFHFGQRVTKTKGSSWTGKIVGVYSTKLTPVGYAVESENEPGSVQIYPASALAAMEAPHADG